MHCFACNKYEPGNLEVDGSNPDIGQTFSYWERGEGRRIWKGQQEGELGKQELYEEKYKKSASFYQQGLLTINAPLL